MNARNETRRRAMISPAFQYGGMIVADKTPYDRRSPMEHERDAGDQHRARKDAIKQAAGERRAQAYRAIRWAEQQLGACTTDAMRARLLEETIRRANERAPCRTAADMMEQHKDAMVRLAWR